MSFLGLHIADVFVLGLYLIGITCIGIWAARRIKNIADFFMPRKFGKAMMVCARNETFQGHYNCRCL